MTSLLSDHGRAEADGHHEAAEILRDLDVLDLEILGQLLTTATSLLARTDASSLSHARRSGVVRALRERLDNLRGAS